MKNKSQASQTLHFAEVDESWYESAERCAYALRDSRSEYDAPKDRDRSWSILSKSTGKELFKTPRKVSAVKWIKDKTGKSVVFVSHSEWRKLAHGK